MMEQDPSLVFVGRFDVGESRRYTLFTRFREEERVYIAGRENGWTLTPLNIVLGNRGDLEKIGVPLKDHIQIVNIFTDAIRAGLIA